TGRGVGRESGTARPAVLLAVPRGGRALRLAAGTDLVRDDGVLRGDARNRIGLEGRPPGAAAAGDRLPRRQRQPDLASVAQLERLGACPQGGRPPKVLPTSPASRP